MDCNYISCQCYELCSPVLYPYVGITVVAFVWVKGRGINVHEYSTFIIGESCISAVETNSGDLYNSYSSQRLTHPLTLHPFSNTDIFVGLLFRQVDVASGRIWTTSLGGEVSAALIILSWFDWEGGQLKLYIWEIKKNTDTSWCCTYWGSPWTLQAKVSQPDWRSWTRPEDLDKFSMNCGEEDNGSV